MPSIAFLSLLLCVAACARAAEPAADYRLQAVPGATRAASDKFKFIFGPAICASSDRIPCLTPA